MPNPTPHYFIRVNGDTKHNNPAFPKCFVPGEPPTFPATYFNYADYCLTNGIIRIGWPAVGDLRTLPDVPESTPCYGPIPTHIRNYLREFRDIPVDSTILMPDKDRPGTLYIGTTAAPYLYSHDPPRRPFECAHTIPVKWDRKDNAFAEYDAHTLGIPPRGGFWLRAFHRLDKSPHSPLVAAIASARQARDR